MSNPLATFRKHRTFWMAGLVLVAILSFIVVPAIQQASTLMINDVGNAVVVRWKGGQITESDLAYNRAQHGRVMRFLTALARKVIEAGGMPGIPGFDYDPQQKQIRSLGIPEFNSDIAQCRTRILAARAKQLGIEFSDEAVDAFIKDFCNRKIPRDDFKALFEETTDKQLSQFDLYQQLKIEMAAVVMERLALAGVNNGGLPLLTPGKMWQNYLRLNQSARIEAFPVATEDYKKQVTGEPTSAELEQLYSQGSQIEPAPGISAPAFRRRYKANVEFVSGSWNKLVDQEKGKISEEKLRAEYDRQIKLNQLQVPVETSAPSGPLSPASPTTPPTDSSATALPATTPPAVTPPAVSPPTGSVVPPSPAAGQGPSTTTTEAKPTEAKASDSQSQTPTAPASVPAATDSAKPQDPPTKPADEAKPADQPKPVEVKSDRPTPAAAKQPEVSPSEPPKSSAADRSSAFRFVSTAQEAPTPAGTSSPTVPVAQATTSAPATAGPATTAPTTAASTETSPVTNASNASSAPAQSTSAVEAAAPLAAGSIGTVTATDQNAPPPVAQPPQLGAPANEPLATAVPTTPEAPKMRTQTFEEAKDTIARTLAFDPVRELVSAKMQKVEQEMSRYYGKLSMARAAEEMGQPSETVPARPDLKKLAESEGLEYGQSGMVDGYALSALPVGLSAIGSMNSQMNVANAIMNTQVELFSTMRSTYMDRAAIMRGESPDFQEFVFWKVDQQLSATPPLEEIRSEVAEVWKSQRAQEIAAREAENLAKKVATAGAEGWKSALPATDQALVLSTGQFTWMTQSQGGMFGSPTLSQVDGISGAGNEFMNKIFSVEPGSLTVAPNQGRSTFYVAKVIEVTPPVDELRTRFQSDNLRMAPRNLAFEEAQGMFRSWYENIEANMQVEWLVTMDQLN